MDFGLSDEQAALQQTARAFVDRHCPPALAKEWDETGFFPEHLIKAMAEMGWFALAFPGEEDGGGGEGGPAELAIIAEQLAYAVSKAALERFTTGHATELSATGIRVNCVRVDEALRTEALAALIGDPEPDRRGVTPAELGAAVRWIVRQPASFTGHVLTFQRLRELGALPVHDTGGVR